MERVLAFLLMLGISALPLSNTAVAEQPKKTSVYYMRKAFCQREAAAKHFGVHWVKRQHYIQKCLTESGR
jgi:hypothetical protein